MQAELHLLGGTMRDGLDDLRRTLRFVERQHIGDFQAELHRLAACMLLAGPRDEAQAASHLEAANRVARRQHARMWELRAAASLARLWAKQGERRKAHDVLAPIHSWFTEGFDTADLKEAKALLEELA